MSKVILSNIIEDFNPDKFTRFFREKNRTFSPRKEELNQYSDESFKNGLKLGEINFATEEQMIICIFEANQPLSERSGKKAQYEKGKRILREQQADSGIFIFCDKKGDFRFSLIYANYLGKRRDWSTFRRFTYFVSREFTNKTFLQRIGDGEFSTIENIKEAFSVEPVNKEFYARIAMLFTKLAGGERRIGKDEFKGKGLLHLPSTIDDTLNKEFTIRLIGRLVFCWFLKKKHSESGLPLLSNELLSMGALIKNENYYHSILEPLFFETLNTPAEERKKKFQSEPWVQVPFLNGGLFSPDEHDFYEVNELGISEFINVLKVPDKWIKDMLEVFETYNFTIDENTSVDIELAIDPEILGRIFENLLAEINPETGETARKSTGSYYTPRPIVEYMVDESLRQYLLNKTKVSEDKISRLLSYDAEEIALGEADKDAVLDALDTIKIIDPACGSGAFPMGILHKMLLILQRIDPDSQKWIDKKLSQIESVTVRKELGKKLRKENWNYVHKLGIIQSSIYGVDIQPIATEISRLRFLLSLIVDEKVEDSEQNRGVDSLPNLEFKFVCANSLIPLAEEKGELFDNKEMAQQMQDIRDRYFKTDSPRVKSKMKNDFEDVLKRGCSLFASQKQKQLLTYHPFDTNNVCSFFNSKFMFDLDGFDIVIANPPYVRVQSISQDIKNLCETQYKTAKGKYDLYILFTELGLNLLRKDGCLSYIMPNKFTNTNYGTELRRIILDSSRVINYVDFSDKGVFLNATNYPCILLAIKSDSGVDDFTYHKVKVISNTLVSSLAKAERVASYEDDNVSSFKCKQKHLSADFWSFGDEKLSCLLRKLKNNKYYVLLKDFREHVFEGLVTGNNKIYFVSKEIISESKIEKELIKKLPKGRNIEKYYFKWDNYYVIYPYVSENNKMQLLKLNQYPNAQRYFRQYKDELEKRSYLIEARKEWYEIWNPRKIEWFQQTKIITPNLSKVNKFALDIVGNKNDYFVLDHDCYGIILKDKSLKNYYFFLGILNSSITDFFIKNISPMFSGGYYKYHTQYLEQLPIPIEINIGLSKNIINSVDKILTIATQEEYCENHLQQAKVKEYERQIDQMVYKLYGLTEEEIKIVEN